MAYTNIDKPTDYFDTKLYTGNAGTQSITMDFATDFIWNKQRNGTLENYLFNSVTGTGKFLKSNSTAAEGTNTSTVTSFNSDGFTLGSAAGNNGSGNTMVSWNWKETATAGFDIVLYTGNGSNRTISHSLSAVPKMIIIKDRSAADNWNVYNSSSGNNSHMHLNLTNAASGSSSYWNTTTPTSSVFSLGSNSAVNANGNNFIAYCFADVQGYSKFGSYTGNGSTNGTFVYTGFKPAFVMVKRTDSTANWQILDNKRNPYNPCNTALFPDTTDPDTTDYSTDHLSNGFKLRVTTTSRNGSGATYIYMAFAENPFVTSTAIPACAR